MTVVRRMLVGCMGCGEAHWRDYLTHPPVWSQASNGGITVRCAHCNVELERTYQDLEKHTMAGTRYAGPFA